jgi:hypothetical protein
MRSNTGGHSPALSCRNSPGFIEAAGLPQCDAQIGARGRLGGLCADCLFQYGNGLIQAAAFLQRDAEFAQKQRIARTLSARLLKQRKRFIPALQHQQLGRQVVKRITVSWFCRKRRPIAVSARAFDRSASATPRL